MSDHSHGTRSGYRKHRCRCALCRFWNTNEAKRYWKEREKRTGEKRKSGWPTYNFIHQR